MRGYSSARCRCSVFVYLPLLLGENAATIRSASLMNINIDMMVVALDCTILDCTGEF